MTKEDLLTNVRWLIEINLQRKKDIDWKSLASCVRLEQDIIKEIE